MFGSKKISILFFAAIFSFLLIRFFTRDGRSPRYGREANNIRVNAKVPKIGQSMKTGNIPGSVEGGRWENKLDVDSGIVHLWKTVIPGNGRNVLHEEIDTYRNIESSDSYWQLNIHSTIIMDSISQRSGTLTKFDNGDFGATILLDERNLDSIFLDWGLVELVKTDIRIE